MTAVLFDLDGVLVESREWHFDALNEALSHYAGTRIAPAERERFEGLPTRVKLGMLVEDGRVHPDNIPAILASKHYQTRRIIQSRCKPDKSKSDLFARLRRDGIATAVVSNAIPETVGAILGRMDLAPDFIASNETAPRPKPHPDPYIVAMYELGTVPERTLIVEDAPPGIAAAKASGAKVLEVTGPEDVTTATIMAALP